MKMKMKMRSCAQHPGLPQNFDAPRSWDEFVWTGGGKVVRCNDTVNGHPVWDGHAPGVRCQIGAGGLGPSGCGNETGAIVDADRGHASVNWCAVNRSRLDSPLVDDLTLSSAFAFLDRLKTLPSKTPWFLAVGWHKPHTPWNFPYEFGELYDEATIALPKRPHMPAGSYPGGWHVAPFNESWSTPTPDPYVKQLRRAYYATVSYVDSLTGALLKKLDETGMSDDTAVLFMGDHGWHLGELNIWEKMTTFELGTRVPLLVRAPFVKSATPGGKRKALVEAVDLYKTAVSLAGLPPPSESDGVQGEDLTPLLSADDLGTRYAFSQFAKGYQWSKELQAEEAWNTCGQVDRSDFSVMGFSVRASDGWRYTEWRKWNGTAQRAEWGSSSRGDTLLARELYAQPDECGGDFDCQSPVDNVWNSTPAHRAISDSLAAVVREHFQHDYSVPAVGTSGAAPTTHNSSSAPKPNLILILTDDQDLLLGSMAALPATAAALTSSARNHFVNTPICCPSRATLLSGRFAHNNRQVAFDSPNGCMHMNTSQADNPDFNNKHTFGPHVQAQGYRTGYFGKYLNINPGQSIICGQDGQWVIPSGWDRWMVMCKPNYARQVWNDQGAYRLTNTALRPGDYTTSVIGNATVDWLHQLDADQPFLAVVAPHAPHLPATPAPWYTHAGPPQTAPRTHGWNASGLEQHHWEIAMQPPLDALDVRSIDVEFTDRQRTLLSVDDILVALEGTLKQDGRWDNTFVLFTSDRECTNFSVHPRACVRSLPSATLQATVFFALTTPCSFSRLSRIP